MKPLRIISALGAVAGLLLCLQIGLDRHLPWGGGCAHGVLFDCDFVQRSAASRLVGIPIWIWGGAWFVLLFILTLWGGAPKSAAMRWITGTVAALGWMMVGHLRGVELFIVGKACIICWLVGVAAIVAGLWVLARAVGGLDVGRRTQALGLLAVVVVASFFGAALRPEEAPPEILPPPEIPGWTWFTPEEGQSFDAIDLMLCGEDAPTLVLVYDQDCPDCQELREGLLADEEIGLFLSEICRTAVLFDHMIRSPLMAEIPRTPAMLLIGPGGEIAASVMGTIEESDVLDLVAQSLGP